MVARGWRARDLLVAAQVALSIVLLTVGGLMLRAIFGLVTGDPGFEAGVTIVLISTMRMPPYTAESAEAFHRRLVDRVRAIRGVASVAFTTSVRPGPPVEIHVPREPPNDPVAYAVVLALVAAVSLAAMVGPARRAASSDPVAALRQE